MSQFRVSPGLALAQARLAADELDHSWARPPPESTLGNCVLGQGAKVKVFSRSISPKRHRSALARKNFYDP